MQKKWRNLRDTFKRELALQKKVTSGQAARKKKKYLYFDALSFLIPTTIQRESSGNITFEDDSTQSEADAGADIAIANRRLATTLRKKSNTHEKTDCEEELLDILKNKNQTWDEDVSFSEMIIPMLKNLNIDQKHYAKVEIMNILNKARYFVSPPMQVYTQPSSPISQTHYLPSQAAQQPRSQITRKTPQRTIIAPPSNIILKKQLEPQPSTSSCADYLQQFTMDLSDCNTSESEELYDLGGLYDSHT